MRVNVIAPKDEVENDEGYYDAEDTRQGKIKPVLHHQEGEQAFKHLVETWSVPPRDQPKTPLAVVTLKSRDNFNSEYMYDVSVKNLSSDPLVAESLIIVLDKITNTGGDEWSSGTSRLRKNHFGTAEGLWAETGALTETEGTCVAIASSQDSRLQSNSDAHSERPAI
jgi:hypothetical protein